MPEDNQEELDVTEEEEPKKKKKPLLLYLIILVVLGLGMGGAYYFYGHKIMAMLPGRSAASETAQKDKGKEGEKDKDKDKKHAPGPIVTLEPFIFNVAGNPSKFAKITLGIELKNAKVEEEVKKTMPAMRDKILLVLGVKPAEVFLDVNQRNAVKDELQQSLKGLFKESGDLNAVYVTDIIIQ
jgi:flagellar protein FliL